MHSMLFPAAWAVERVASTFGARNWASKLWVGGVSMQTGKRVGGQEAASSPDQKIVRRQSDVGGRQTVNGKRLRWTGVGDGPTWPRSRAGN